jgi:DNA replication protein DnaC
MRTSRCGSELAEFDWSCVPDVPKPRILDLAQGGSISRTEPVILIGNPGLGKTHVATGLALAACRQGRRVRFYTVAGLVNDLIKAQQEYRLSRFMTQVTKYELIVLDEPQFIPFTATGAQLLFQLCSALYERVALMVTTHLRFADWSRVMGGDERMSAARTGGSGSSRNGSAGGNRSSLKEEETWRRFHL